ncbi:hypothetical protein G7Y89_g984 [Cudoniella acicularis]|uniref:Alpha/beta hydrolase fold-3 domain-containing protein n=1 Tax=Cudoniella acicularis TaxID=354080 RepID=A0A8H4W9X4_9HELO|nr:hypothetical protein G7Y89_g984 [Cudoniella acicularis]
MRSSILEIVGTKTISEQQERSLKTPPVAFPAWIAQHTIPPDDNVQKILLQVIESLGDFAPSYASPKSVEVTLEWIGYRKEISDKTPRTPMSQKEKYVSLLEEFPLPGVIMFIYGGSFYTNHQPSYRKIVTRLSMMTGRRCVTVSQRLAPQDPFPSALLDVFHGYLSLLSPPAGSLNAPISPENIILAGDSSGACLALGLIQTILTLRRNGLSSINFHGNTVELALPAGLTLLSTVGDLTNGLPSTKENFNSDYFPLGGPPSNQLGFPTCSLWPTNPIRDNIYCDATTLYHPIAGPAAAKDWTGSPPLCFLSGQEQAIDGVNIIAQTAYNQGVPIFLQEYETMPHCFMWLLPESPQAQKCWKVWSRLCTSLLKTGIKPEATFVKAKGVEEEQRDLRNISRLDVDEARILMREGAKIHKFPSGKRAGGAML